MGEISKGGIMEKCVEHAEKLQRLETNMHKFEIKLTKIESTTEYIKGRMDNGISTTITKIYDKLNEICPTVKDNKEVVDKVKAGSFWVIVVGLVGGFLSFMWQMARSMIK